MTSEYRQVLIVVLLWACIVTVQTVTLCKSNTAFSTSNTYGKTFYVPFPQKSATDSGGTVFKYRIHISNPRNVDITVTAKVLDGTPPTGGTTNHVVAPASTKSFDVDDTLMITGNSVSTKKAILSSNSDFGVRLTTTVHMDGFTALPLEMWGKEYRVVTYCGYLIDTCQIVIVAQNDHTEVAVSLPQENSRTVGMLYQGSQEKELSKIMQAGEVWQIQRDYDLTGTHIWANESIGVLSGNAAVYVGDGYSQGAFMEPIPPIKTMGTQFISFLTPGRRETGDLLRVVALYDQTIVYISSAYQKFEIHAGFYITSQFHDEMVHIESTRPILVVKFSQSQQTIYELGGPTMSLVVPTQQFFGGVKAISKVMGAGALEEYLVLITKQKYEDCFENVVPGVLTLESEHSLNVTDFVVKVYKFMNGVTEFQLYCTEKPEAEFLAYHVYRTSTVFEQSLLAFQLDTINKPCIVSPQSPGDMIDNDCNGEIDEEECTEANQNSFTDCGPIHTGDLDILGKKFTFVIPAGSDQNETAQIYIVKGSDETTEINLKYSGRSNPETFVLEVSEKSRVIVLDLEYQLMGSRVFTEKTIQLTSNKEIMATFVLHSIDSTEYLAVSTRLIPDDTLYGTEYFVVTLCEQNECQFQVTALHPGDTELRIQLKSGPGIENVTFEGITYKGNEAFCVTLRELEALQLQSLRDLTGTQIISNKPIAVMSGGRKTLLVVPFYPDGLLEQLPPVSMWGKQYFAINQNKIISVNLCGSADCADRLKIVASLPDTKVQLLSQGHGEDIYLLTHPGDFIFIKMKSPIVRIEATKPILLVQIHISTFTVEVESSVLTPIGRHLPQDMILLTQGASFEYFFMVYTHSLINDSSVLLLGGSPPITMTYDELLGISYYSGTYDYEVDKPVYVRTNSTNPYPLSGFVYTFGSGMAFSAPLAFKMDPINHICELQRTSREDGIDNDCDGEIDEESCNAGFKDEDDDGMYNEDCGPSNVQESTTSTVNLDPTSTNLANITNINHTPDANHLMPKPTTPDLSYDVNNSPQSSPTVIPTITNFNSTSNPNFHLVEIPCPDVTTSTQSTAVGNYPLIAPQAPCYSYVPKYISSVQTYSTNSPLQLSSTIHWESIETTTFMNVMSPSTVYPVMSSSAIQHISSSQYIVASTETNAEVTSTPVLSPSPSLSSSYYPPQTTTTTAQSNAEVTPVLSPSPSLSSSYYPPQTTTTTAQSNADVTPVLSPSPSLSSSYYPPQTTTTTAQSNAEVTPVLSPSPSLSSSYYPPVPTTNPQSTAALHASSSISSSSTTSVTLNQVPTHPTTTTQTPTSPPTSPVTSNNVATTTSTAPSTTSSSTTLISPSSTEVTTSMNSCLTTSGGANVPGPDGYCSCECPANVQSNLLESSELNQVIKSIQKELYVDKKEVSKTKRKLISAEDSRPSAQTVGWFGVSLVAIVVVFLVAFDVPTLMVEIAALIRLCKDGIRR